VNAQTPIAKAEIQRTFRAERRNLLLVSVVLFLVEYSDLQFEKINVLGNEAKLGDPRVLHFLLWVFWLYFLWRYYQHFRELREAVDAPAIRNVYQQKLMDILTPTVHQRYKQLFEPSSTYLNRGSPKFSFTRSAQWRFHSLWHITANLAARADYKLENGAFAQDAEKALDIELNWKDLLWPQIKATVFILKNVSQVTEYYLPFFVASILVLYVLLRPGWNWLAKQF